MSAALLSRGNYIQGAFGHPADPQGEWVAKSPADSTDELGRFQYSYSSVEDAVGAARKAFASWRTKSVAERGEYLKRYQAAIKRRENELAEIMAREVGKPLWEAKTEVTAMLGKVDITLTDSMKYVADLEIPRVMDGTHGACKYLPLGVMAVIDRFTLPAILPTDTFCSRNFTGNTVVFKPPRRRHHRSGHR